MITFEERYRAEMRQRRERPFTTLPVYRFEMLCGVCLTDSHKHADFCTYEKRQGSLPVEKIIRSYTRQNGG